MKVRRACAVVASACVLLATSSAFADDKDAEHAVQLMREGVQKREAQDLRGALKSFEEAEGLVQIPSISAEVAKTRAQLGLLKEALEAADRATAYPQKDNEPKPWRQARKDCEALKTDVQSRMPTLAIHVTGLKPGEACSVSVGKLAAPCSATDKPQRMNPGPYHIVVAALGDETVKDVTLAERRNEVVDIELTPKPKPGGDDKGGNGTARYLFWGGVIVGGVGVGAGTVTGIMSLTRANDAKAVCKNNQCPANASDAIATARTLGTVSTIAFIAGGAGIVCGIAGLVMGPFGSKDKPAENADPEKKEEAKKDARVRVMPTLWLGGAGVTGTF